MMSSEEALGRALVQLRDTKDLLNELHQNLHDPHLAHYNRARIRVRITSIESMLGIVGGGREVVIAQPLVQS